MTKLASGRFQKHRLTMEHFLTRPREESTMIQSTRPKLNRFKYAAMLVGALAVAATPLAYPAVATAQRYWDIELYQECEHRVVEKSDNREITTQEKFYEEISKCCVGTGGVWNPFTRECYAPSGKQGSRQLPGNVSDIATAPTVTREPLYPIPADIATAPTVTEEGS
jgi:hypothetical protein